MSDSNLHMFHILTAKKPCVAERLDTTLVSEQGNREDRAIVALLKLMFCISFQVLDTRLVTFQKS